MFTSLKPGPHKPMRPWTMELDGEHLDMVERVVVSPGAGVFVVAGHVPHRLEPGTPLGRLEGNGGSVLVVSPCSGWLGAMVATTGERLRTHQRVAWLRVS